MAADAADDPRRHSPAAERNREPILAQLRRWLPARGRMLEIASGTGQHAVHFAAGLPGWLWQPTDASTSAVASIAVWRSEAGLANLLPPVALDALAPDWPLAGAFDAIFCANMLHISPWPACSALMRGAARHLAAGGQLILYGPFLVDGVETAPSNLAFDADLRTRDPAWGLRQLADVQAEAAAAGLALGERAPMPANNLMLRFSGATAASPAPARR
ncbi:MAG: DUF938 domain-containing protein [Ideonella sp.]|nr:DUF938 domain-containing protein [Ideonella sp.]